MSREEREQQIKEAAKKVFLEKGFRNTVMDDIMQETKLSRGGLYHHYKSTSEILYDIMDEGNRMREKAVKSTIELRQGLSFNEIVTETIVDKILSENDFIPIYAMFLQEIKQDKNLNNLYEKLKEKSTKTILELFNCTDNSENIVSSLDLIINFINTMILGCEILQVRDNFRNNKDILKKMILVVLNNKEE
ncbi:TetR/AcrR family transcriptional regulator [Anaerosphaera multitolerans]|uniref:TetR/AcrR family transcriptional regulator n=2 Tax=Anaerosphaera multitolerans TaxID=2487351 RepID=A0A437S618_9FIRM|nr:TetR/AcrR family transcriptional regulator [Anaerosphaera multitolerans]